MTQKVLVVSPAYNEAGILPRFLEEFLKFRARLLKEERVELRLLVINDGSSDDTKKVLEIAASELSQVVSYLNFHANFGHQAALIAGLSNIGDWPDTVVTMDCDLEHPLEVVEEMIRAKDEQDLKLVNTVRTENTELPLFKRWLSKLFYQVTARMTGLEIVPGQADFKMWDASLVRSLQPYLQNVGSMRVFAAWLPVKKANIYYQQPVQDNRVSRFTFKKNVDLAVISILKYSNLPLKGILFAGGFGIFLTLLYAAFALVRFSQGYAVAGWTSLLLTIIFMGCLQLVSLGVIASYLQKLVFAKDLPRFLIEEPSTSSMKRPELEETRI